MKAQAEQLPPHSIEAEESVLGSFLLDPTCIVIVSPFLRADDFYREKNGMIYAAMLDLYNSGSQIDVVTLGNRLNRGGKLAEVGGSAYMSELMNAVPTAAHVEHYARIVQEKARLRRLINLGVQVVKDAYSADAESGPVWESAKKQLDAALSEQATDSVLEHKASLVSYLGTLGEREQEAACGKVPMTVPWEDLARYVPMLRNGSLVSVAAQSGVGKTVFMESLSEAWAQDGFRVAFFHLELSHEIMLDRRMARHSGVSIEDLWRGVSNDAVAEATARMDTWAGNIVYVHCPGWSMQRIALKSRELAGRRRLDAVIVDYLQKIPYADRGKGLNTAQMRGQDVETIKSLAEDMGVVAILGSQLSRQNEIRDTGEALEKCNVSIRLERPLLDDGAIGGTVVHTGEMGPEVTITVDKNTLGRTGKAKMLLIGPRFMLGSLADGRPGRGD
jgi:replicative DNA helicase